MSTKDKLKPDGTIDYRARRKNKNPPKGLKYRRAIWNRLDKEPEDAWGAYRRYRDIDYEERDLDLFFEKYPTYTENQISKWYEKYKWKERIDCWDSSQRSRVATYQMLAQRRMKDRHAKLGQALTMFAGQELIKWQKRDSEELLPIGGIIDLVKTGSAVERLSRDLPTEMTRTEEVPLDVSRLSPEELKRLKEMKKKLRTVEKKAEK